MCIRDRSFMSPEPSQSRQRRPDDSGNPDAIALLRDEIARDGAITFARFMEVAIYHPDFGYYRTPIRRPGRGGDFITSPEVHPFFGFTIADQLAGMWDRLDRPDPFVVREYLSLIHI